MKRLVFAAILAGITGGAMAQGTGDGPAKDPTANGGNTVVNQGAGSGTGTTDKERGLATGTPKADPTENGGNTVVNRGAGSGTGTEAPTR
ncbi:hypothetical protein ASG52_21695 [Methylobacterium sp. Leaf456]|uniref:hypothetical protein n=1 Tax=Methylobacterium sp. Leaf456 TaxID=1736382 RepID=UPI0007003749|nr:hypothetical protein [Methylobacterium sp. Leaf456]KQT58472.1 hypothetical protein ASG52_21695 [Methylobacterium sp. Leaf456]